ncbi:MAG TPA: acetate--CoA ligase [Gemmatimonadales bacterium]|nr:acetate--CoA ligase [Gemmatimonadales bacterium]
MEPIHGYAGGSPAGPAGLQPEPVAERSRWIAPPPAGITSPNLPDYEAACAGFSWASARAELDGLPGGGLNIAHEAVDRHATGPDASRVALRWLGRDGNRRDFSFAELKALSNRFANALLGLGIQPGDRVVSVLGRLPELHVAALGTWKLGAVFCPLFSAFGPEPLRTRLEKSGARVLITTSALYQKKVAPVRGALPALEHVILVGGVSAPLAGSGVHDWEVLLTASDPGFTIPATDPETGALIHFTSGTTGMPKGALHVHGAVLAHHVTGRMALDLHPGDIFWCTADPGWVTGISYGVIAPLSNGVTCILDEADFDARRWYELLARERVTVWYTAPTAIRMLMKAGPELAREYDLSALRFLASVGEPLNPEAVVWSHEVFGRPFHDNWWQTETGGIMIANFASTEVRPGSMGRPLPGIEAAIVRRTAEGPVAELPAESVGELALRPGWPSMFRTYWGEPERYAKCFAGGYYLTGDLARRDADGYYWFVGRADDVIKTMGHLIGPFEVESALLEHPAVAEAAVIGKPDPVAGELVKAFVALKGNFPPDEALRRDLLAFARTRLGAVVAPKEIAFLPTIPRTRSGKIMRRLLKARELGLPEGDTSTLEEAGYDHR